MARRRRDAAEGRGTGRSLNDLAALYHLAASPDGTRRRQELADLLGMTPSGVTRLLAPLEKLGYVTRDTHPRDARLSLIVLTQGGAARARDALAEAEERAQALRAQALLGRVLDPEQTSTLAALLAQMGPT